MSRWKLAFVALFFALAGEPEASPAFDPEGVRSAAVSRSAEDAWARAAADFDRLTPDGEARAWTADRRDDRPSGKRGYEPFSDRKDFALAPLGIFGVFLMLWAGLVESPFVRSLGAALIVVGFVLFSGLA